MSREITLPRSDLVHVLDALDTFEAELEQLEYTRDWFLSDSKDRLASAKQIVCNHLGIEPYEHEYDEELEQGTFELLFE